MAVSRREGGVGVGVGAAWGRRGGSVGAVIAPSGQLGQDAQRKDCCGNLREKKRQERWSWERLRWLQVLMYLICHMCKILKICC